MSTQTHIESARQLAKNIADENPNLQNSGCLLAMPLISYPSGLRTLSEAEVSVEGDKIKSSALHKADLSVFPQTSLQKFNTIRVAAKRIITDNAVNVGGLFLIPITKLADVMQRLGEKQTEWDAEFIVLEDEYENIIEQHKRDESNIAHLISKHKIDKHDFTSVFKFQIRPPLAIKTLFEHDEQELIDTASVSLWEEVAKEAKSKYYSSFTMKDQISPVERVSQKAITSLKKLRSKLINLSFLHDGVDNIIEIFDSIINDMPKTGYIEGTPLLRLSNFVLQFSDAVRLEQVANGDSTGITDIEFEADIEEETLDTSFDDLEQPSDFDDVPDSDFQDDFSSDTFNVSQSESAPMQLGWGSF